jgi:hypothetical protein
MSKENKARNISTFDFGQMYTNLEHKDICTRMYKVLNLAFGKFSHIWISDRRASWQQPHNAHKYIKIEKSIFLRMIEFVVDNTYFQFGGDVYKQIIGVPMGTDCAPLVANLTLFSYEFDFMTKCMKTKRFEVLRKLQYCFRYIDDISVINDDDYFETIWKEIYPSSLTLKKMNRSNNEAEILDIEVKVINRKFFSKVYNKRLSFPFTCNIFPCIQSNISITSMHNIFYSQLYRFFEICSDLIGLEEALSNLAGILCNKNYDSFRLFSLSMKFLHRNVKFHRKFGYIEIKTIIKNSFNGKMDCRSKPQNYESRRNGRIPAVPLMRAGVR